MAVRWMWPPSSETLSSIFFGERVHAARVLADDELLQLADGRLRRADEAVQRPFADPMDAGIGQSLTNSQFFQPAPTV